MCSLTSIVRNIPKYAIYFDRHCAALNILRDASPFGHRKRGNSIPSLGVWRTYAKSADKSKKGAPRIEIVEAELAEVFDVGKLFSQYEAVVLAFREQLLAQTNLRTTPGAIEDLKVKHDGKTYMIRDLAEVGRKGGKEVILEMGVFPGAIPHVMDAIRNSSLGLNPTQDGSKIFIQIPKVTKERREAMAKGAKALFNKLKTSIRDVQNKNIKKLTSIDTISEDTVHRLKAQLVSLGDKHITEAEDMLKVKEKELLSTS